MKTLNYVFAGMASIAAIIVILITSFEIAAYSDFSWYEKEYRKYEIQEDLPMEMADIINVTEEMMAYLRGNRENLVVNTFVNGQEREFFNEREKAHMVDVQTLFIGGLKIRRFAIAIMIVSVAIVALMKEDWKRILPRAFLGSLGFVTVVGAVFGVLCAQNFHKYFFLFHEIFFDNDLWLLDPETDLLIRMLPEGFFFDMVFRIGSIFLATLVLMLAICIGVIRKEKNKKNL